MCINYNLKIRILGIASFCLLLLSACSQDVLDVTRQTEDSQTKATGIVYTEIELKEVGMLAALLGNEKNTLENLRLKGVFNALDARCLREMKALKNLDMLNVQIKGGDEVYSSYRKLEDNKIGESMFSSLSSLRSVILPASVTDVGSSAFASCTELLSVQLPPKLKRIAWGLFSGSRKLETVNIPEGVLVIEGNAFCSTALKSIVIPEGVITIDQDAFRDIPTITQIDIPNTVTSIGERAFMACVKLQSCKLPKGLKIIPGYLFEGCGSFTTVVMPENVEKIGYDVFKKTALKSFVIPESVVSIGGGVFVGCRELVSCQLPSNMKEIPEYFFADCEKLPSLVIPDGVKKIGSKAFLNCSSLSNVVLPEGLQEIDYAAFGACHAMTSITVPSSVTSVSNLTQGSIPANLTSIFWNTPVNCEGVNIPANCLVYVSTGATMPVEWKTAIYSGQAEKIVLKDESVFNCPQDFYTKEITFKRSFSMETGNGEAAGWETIILPFDVQTIKDKDGNILSPFGNEISGAKYFWLRELTANGFKDATKIEANKPYIIAMPNHPNYDAKYIITGDVTFEATNTTVKATPSALTVLQGPDFSMTPVYRTQPKMNFVYPINKGWMASGQKAGSVFIAGLRDVLPFEAYITPNKNNGSPRMMRIDTPVRTRSGNGNGNIPLKDRM